MTGKQTLFQMIIYGMIALAAVIGAVILGYNGSLNSDAVAAILVGALALAGGSAASTGAVYAAVNGKSTVTPQLLAEQGATNRTALVAAAASAPTQIVASEVTPTPHPQ
jgi:hypothetical protein